MAFPSPQELLGKVQGGPSSPSLFDAPATSLPSPQSILTKVQSQENPAGPSFGASLFDKAKSIGKSVLGSIGSFLGTQASNIKAAATGEIKVTPDDVLQGVKTTAIGTGNAVKSIAEGFNEGVARFIKSGSEAVIGKEATEKIAGAELGGVPGLSISGFSKAATGKDSISSFQDIYSRAENYALENNASIDQAKSFAGLTVVGAMFIDNPAFGPGKGSVIKLSEKAIKDLAQETGEDAIKTILKTEIPGLTDNELNVLAPVFRNAKSEDEIRATIEQLDKVSRAPLREGVDDGLPNPDELLSRSRKSIELPRAPGAIDEAPASSFFRAVPDDAAGITRFEAVGDAAPIKIIDGFETFIRRGENDTYEVLEATTGRRIGKISDTPEEAVESATKALEGKSPDEIRARIESFKDRSPRNAPPGAPGRATGRGVSKTAPVQEPFDRQLIRSISTETAPDGVGEILRKHFPTLSDQALIPIAKRLAKLSRTSDIEGILYVVRNIDREIQAARGSARRLGDSSIAVVGKKEPVGDLPASIGQLLTDKERGRYLDNISRTIKSREDAVLAQQEYDALWEHADQRVIDRYEELKLMRDIMREQLDIHPGKDINALYKGTFLSPDDVELDELIEQRRGRGLDSRISEIMGGQDQQGVVDTVAQGQKALKDWREMREQIKEIEAELRELRPKARAARILQDMVEDVPVITRQRAGEIESLADPEDIRKIYKDISGFSGQSRDVYRNFEAVFGPRFEEVKKVILDPFDKSKGEMVDELKKLGDDIEKNVVKKLGIARGSKESAAVQLYGEGKISHEELIKMVGSDRVGAVMDAVAYFRRTYDRLLDEVNASRAKIFPNDPSKLIQKRKDYFRHFQEMSDGFKGLIAIFDTPAGINPQLAGLSEFTKPKSKFLSFAQERVGKDSEIDAVGGFLNYAPAFAYAKHIDPHIGNFRYLRRRLAESAPTPGTKEVVEAKDSYAAAMGATDLVKQEGLNNFLSFLDDFANDLAGKTNPMDRYIQKIIPGGRKTFQVIDWINSRVKANTILGNLSSSIAQAFNIPQGIASAKLYSVPGINRTLSSIFVENEPMKASSFIKERYQDDLKERFKIDWANHPVARSTEEAKQVAVWLTSALDEFGTKFIWNSHYQKALAEGVEDPIKYADDTTRKLVAGRGVGEVPLLQKSRIFQLVAPFQLEVGNAWRVMGDFVRKKDFAALAIFFAASYLMNKAAEEVRGSKVVFDPIESLIDGAVQASDELEDTGSPTRAAFKFAGRQVGELLSNVPLGQTLSAAVPDDWIEGGTGGLIQGKKDLFGAADPGRFGSGLIAVKGIGDPLYKLFPPFGGTQIKKTIEGISSMLEGEVRDRNNNLSFKVDATPLNVAQAVLFGQNATQQAQEFYDQRSDLFNRIYRQDATRTQERVEGEKIWADVKKLSRDEAIAKLQELEQTDPLLADAVAEIAQEEADGLTGTDRLVKMLGVENGERAKYISDLVKQAKTREEKVAILQNFEDKDLISDDVFEQLTLLLEGEFSE